MNLEDKQADLERISELSKIVNDVLYASPSFNTKKLFIENDIYHRLPQEITILDGVQKMPM